MAVAELDSLHAYWRSQLEGAPLVLEVPSDRPRTPFALGRSECLSFRLPHPLVSALRDLGLRFDVTLELVLLAAFGTLLGRYARGRRLWLAALDLQGSLERYLAAHGRPVRYGYVTEHWPLEAYRNVYALESGSAEAPSAGRPFTTALLTRLAAKGVLVAPVVLHTGVSSLELGEEPYPERYRVPEETARLVNAVHGWGGRVVAVGTTVVRALETVAAVDGTVAPGEGWTSLVVTPERGLRAVDGLVTGWHEPAASHIQLLEAAAGADLLERSYAPFITSSSGFNSLANPGFLFGQSFVEYCVLLFFGRQRIGFANKEPFIIASPVEQSATIDFKNARGNFLKKPAVVSHEN